MNSPEKVADQILGTLSVVDAKKFLLDCVNLPNPLATFVRLSNAPFATRSDASPHLDRWLLRWQRLFTFQSESKDGKWRTMEVPRKPLERFVPKLRTTLCGIWVEQDARQRDWYFFRLRDAYHHMIVRAENPYLLNIADENGKKRFLQLERTSRSRRDDLSQRARFFETWMGVDKFEEVPRICPFEAAMYWLQTNHSLMLRCGGPICAAPYFFRTERGQKFCSPECADPARREAKLRWWNQSPNSPKNQLKKNADKKN